MMAALFSFSGRMNRSDFIRWSAIQTIASGLILAAIDGLSARMATAVTSGNSEAGVAPNVTLILILSAGLVIFPSSALIVKRLRDVGLQPWPCFAVIGIADALIAAIVPHDVGITEGPFAGLSFNIVITVLLIFVPGRGEDDDIEDETADWVARAAKAEAKLIEDRRRQSIPTENQAMFDQMRALEALRQKGSIAPDEVPEKAFGRRRGDRW